MPVPDWRQNQVARLHVAGVAIDGRIDTSPGEDEPNGTWCVPVSGCRFMRSQILERAPERRTGKRKTSQPRIGERKHAPITSTFERDQFARTLGQRQNIIPLPEPGLGSRKRNFRHKLLCDLPERLEITCCECSTKLI